MDGVVSESGKVRCAAYRRKVRYPWFTGHAKKGFGMSLAEAHKLPAAAADDGVRVRDLLRCCASTRDRAQRSELLARIAAELERAAEEIAENDDVVKEYPQVVPGLRGQASMARYLAELDQADRRAEAG